MSRIETKRLILSLYADTDKDDFVRMLTDGRVMRYVDKGVLSVSQAETLWRKLMREWYPRGVDTIWKITARNDGRFVGNASVRPRPEFQDEWEIGYYLMPEEWGKGFASEVAKRLVRYGFETLNLADVYATVDIENLASRRVLEKAGLKLFREETDEKGPFYVYRLKAPAAEEFSRS